MADIPFDALPFRLQILHRMTERLRTITRTTADALPQYSYSLAPDGDFPEGKVLRGRGAYGKSDPLPMLSIIEDPKQMERDAVPEQSDAKPGDWDLLIQGFIKDDPVHPTDPAYFLAADVSAVLFAETLNKRDILGFGDKKPMIRELHIGAPVIRPADEISVTSYFWLPLRMCLVEDAASAFLF